MARTVFIHVGAPKTGTTYLQGILDANLRSLTRHGIGIPTTLRSLTPSVFHFRAALDLLGQDWGGRPGHAEGAWTTLVRKVHRHPGTVVFSHEILAGARPEAIARARDELGAEGAELHVVYTVRSPSALLPAAWQESVKQGNDWGFAKFLRRSRRGKTWFARSFDLPTVLERWGADLPAERIHVVTAPQRTEEGAPDPTTLWRRFCQPIGIDPSWAPLTPEHANESLGVAETNVLRALNRHLGSLTHSDISYGRLVREVLARDTLAARPSPRAQLPPRFHPWAEELADDWITWIEHTGVDLVGDVEDLRPRPPVPGRRPRQGGRATLEASIEALAAMTHEAARRERPTDRLVQGIKARRRT